MKKFLTIIIILLIVTNIILYKNNKTESNEIKILLNNYNTNLQLNNRKDSLYIETLKDVKDQQEAIKNIIESIYKNDFQTF